jgi:hypothetical protein
MIFQRLFILQGLIASCNKSKKNLKILFLSLEQFLLHRGITFALTVN